MKLQKIEHKEAIRNYRVEAEFGTFGIIECAYGEESTLVILKKDDEFAVAHCTLYCCRGKFDWDDLHIDGEICCYYSTEDGDNDVNKCIQECGQIMDFICEQYNNNWDEIYNIDRLE